MLRAAVLALFILYAPAAAAQHTAYEHVWRAQPDPARADFDMMPMLGRYGLSILHEDGTLNMFASVSSAPFPQLVWPVMLDDRRFVALADPESHYFSGGVHGRLVTGDIGSPSFTRLNRLGEIRPLAATHALGQNWVLYERDDSRHARIASFADGAVRAQISAPFDASIGDPVGRDLSVADGELRLLSAELGTGADLCTLRLRLFSFDAASLALLRTRETCVEVEMPITLQLTVHRAGTDAWRVVGAQSHRRNETIVWRVSVEADRLSAAEIWRSAAWSDVPLLSVGDAQSGSLFIVRESGPAGSVPIVRIAGDDAVSEHTLASSCAELRGRYQARVSAAREAYLHVHARTAAGACADLWRLR